MYLSIIIPAYNEEKRLPDTLRATAEYLKRVDKEVEIIVVNDGSRDNTASVVKAMQKDIPGLRLISFEENHGKGFAVKKGMLESKGDFALFMDADNATPIEEIEKLWPYESAFDVVIGSRHLERSNVVIKQPWYRILISRVGNFVIQSLLIRGVVDTQCGFKLFSRKAADQIFKRQKITGWGFDMEVLVIAQKVLGLKIKEVPVSWYNAPDSRLRPIRDAWRTFKELLRIKWNLITGKYR